MADPATKAYDMYQSGKWTRERAIAYMVKKGYSELMAIVLVEGR